MLPMLTIVVHISQDNIIYKCTNLHDRKAIRKLNIFCAHIPYFSTFKGRRKPADIFLEKGYFCTYEYIYITENNRIVLLVISTS